MTLSAGAARLLLVPVLLAYLYLAVGYARATPRWNNPDEPAHVNVVRQVATTGTLPVLKPGDWDKPLLDRLTSAWFPNDYEVDGIRYEGHQPPLYYLLAAPVHRLTLGQPLNRQILALRLVSVALGAVAVVAAFVVGREAMPERPALAVLVAATVAFLPMFTAISAAVNNDSLANALAALTLAALLVGRRRGLSDRWAVGLGLLVGALVLTKLTVYVYVPLVLVVLLLDGRRATPRGSCWRAGWWAGLRRAAIAAAVGLAVSGWWLVRNMLVYGPLDPLAMARHDQVVVGQPRWTSYDLEALDYFARILFRSFWGMFGWMGVVLDDGFYLLYLALTLLALAGVLLGRRWSAGPGLRHTGVLLAATLLVVGEVVFYNLTFIQPQGRYLFPALVPIALFLALGWQRLADGALARWPLRLLTAGALAGAIGWSLGEAHGALRAAELWSDDALVGAAAVGVLLVTIAPRAVRARLPDGLCLVLALALGLLDLAALVRFVAPAFPAR